MGGPPPPTGAGQPCQACTPLPGSRHTFWAGAQGAKVPECSVPNHFTPSPLPLCPCQSPAPHCPIHGTVQEWANSSSGSSIPVSLRLIPGQAYHLGPVTQWCVSLEDFLMQEGIPELWSQVCQLLINMPPLTTLFASSVTSGPFRYAEPCLDSRHRKLKHMPLSLFLAPPPQSVPRKLLLFLSLSIWRDGKGRLSNPLKGFSRNCGGKADFKERTTQWRPRGIYTSPVCD